jgi:hypothetical protein
MNNMNNPEHKSQQYINCIFALEVFINDLPFYSILHFQIKNFQILVALKLNLRAFNDI